MKLTIHLGRLCLNGKTFLECDPCEKRLFNQLLIIKKAIELKSKAVKLTN